MVRFRAGKQKKESATNMRVRCETRHENDGGRGLFRLSRRHRDVPNYSPHESAVRGPQSSVVIFLRCPRNRFILSEYVRWGTRSRRIICSARISAL